MTKLAELMRQVRRLPAERKEDVAHVLTAMMEAGTATYRLSNQERTLVDQALNSRLVSPTELREFRIEGTSKNSPRRGGVRVSGLAT